MATMRAKKTVAAPRPATRLGVARPRVHALDVPFEMRAVAAAHRAEWQADHGVFVFRGAVLPPALEPFHAAPYSWERHVERALNDEPEGAQAASRPAGTLTPRPHQRDAVRAITAAAAARRAGFLLADDVGLGKTISAW